jgi:hypothetical protein
MYEGRSYGDLQEEFWKWIFSLNCDKNNIGDVVFLRGVPSTEYEGYTNEPVIMVGDDRLIISEDQAVFFCCYTTMAESIDQSIPNTEIARRADVVLALNHAGIPDRRQIRIDDEVIELYPGTEIMDYRVVTNEFILNVPNPESGKTLARNFDVQLSPGDHPAVAGGYCFLIKFKEGNHYIHSIGRGNPWQQGEYVSELFYEITVINSGREKVNLSLLNSLTKDRTKNKIQELLESKKLKDDIPNSRLINDFK